MAKRLAWDKDKCVFCGGCAAVCPEEKALILRAEVLEIAHEHCTRCGRCVRGCPMLALSLEEV